MSVRNTMTRRLPIQKLKYFPLSHLYLIRIKLLPSYVFPYLTNFSLLDISVRYQRAPLIYVLLTVFENIVVERNNIAGITKNTGSG